MCIRDRFDFKAGSVNKLLMALHIIAEPVNWKMNGLFTQLIVAFVPVSYTHLDVYKRQVDGQTDLRPC